jgi:hypothetical protein
MSLRGALGFAEAVSPYREIASLRQAQDRRRDPEKTSGQASKSPPRNDMPEQLPDLSKNLRESVAKNLIVPQCYKFMQEVYFKINT